MHHFINIWGMTFLMTVTLVAQLGPSVHL